MVASNGRLSPLQLFAHAVPQQPTFDAWRRIRLFSSPPLSSAPRPAQRAHACSQTTLFQIRLGTRSFQGSVWKARPGDGQSNETGVTRAFPGGRRPHQPLIWCFRAPRFILGTTRRRSLDTKRAYHVLYCAGRSRGSQTGTNLNSTFGGAPGERAAGLPSKRVLPQSRCADAVAPTLGAFRRGLCSVSSGGAQTARPRTQPVRRTSSLSSSALCIAPPSVFFYKWGPVRAQCMF